MRNTQPPGRNLELVEHDRGLLGAGFIIDRRDNGGGLEGYQRVHGLVNARDAVEMRFEKASDRRCAIDQGRGGPVDRKKNSDIVHHVVSLTGLRRPEL
jgi:hypothetical protein